MSLSVVINAKNMAETLRPALESCKDLADEIVVVDMKSSDETVSVAKKYTKKVFSYDKDLGFADPARNFALGKAKSDWILVLDADEEVSPGLKEMVQNIIAGRIDSKFQGDCYFIPRKNLIFGQWIQHTGWWPDYQLRLFKRGMAEWSDKVHTQPITKGRVLYLPQSVNLAIVHHNYQTVEQFLERLNRYTTLELANSSNRERITSDAILSSLSGEFFRRFFQQEGIEDGIHGLSLSLLQAMYELVVVLKQWEQLDFVPRLNQPEIIHSLQKFAQELRYWLADYQVKHTSGLEKLFWQVRRKLRL